MAERVLSDADVDASWDGLRPYDQDGSFLTMRQKPSPWFLRLFARAVEAAVLAKITRRRNELDYPSTPSECKEYLHNISKNYVTEREARKRERAACLRCFRDLPLNQTSWLDVHYPLPKCDKCGQELP